MSPTRERDAARGREFDLAVSAEMVFLDLPFEERVRRISDLGFAMEMWSWQDKDIKALANSGATFSSMTGYVHGNIVESDAAKVLLKTAEQTLRQSIVAEKPSRPVFRDQGNDP